MKKFKLLGLLILVFGIFAARGATEEEVEVIKDAEAIGMYRQLRLQELVELAQGVADSEKTACEQKRPEYAQKVYNRKKLKLIMSVIAEKSREQGLATMQMQTAVYEKLSLQELEDIFKIIPIRHPDWKMLLDLIEKKERELGIVKSENPGAGAALPQVSQTLIVYSDGSIKVFNKEQLKKLLFFERFFDFNARLANQKQYVYLGQLFENGEDQDGLFDFVVELANAIPETIDDLHARLSTYSFTDLVTIAQMLDVLMFDNDEFEIERFIADLLLKKFRELSVEDQANFHLSLVPNNVAGKKCDEYILYNKKLRNVNKALFSRGGSRIVVIDLDGHLKMLDARTLVPIRDDLLVPMLDIENVEKVLFSPDGTRIAVIDLAHNLQMFDARTLSRMLDRVQNVFNVVFSSDGRRVAIIPLEGNLQILDVRTLVPIPGAGLRNVFDVEFSSDGRTVAVLHWNRYLQILDAQTLVPIPGAVLQNFFKFEFSPNGKTVAVIDGDKNLQMLDARTLVPMSDRVLQNVRDVVFSPGGRIIAAIDLANNLQILDVQTLVSMSDRVLQNVYKVVFNSDGRRIVVIDFHHKNLQILDAETLFPVTDIVFQNATLIVFSPDTSNILVVSKGNECQLYQKKLLRDVLLRLQEKAIERLTQELAEEVIQQLDVETLEDEVLEKVIQEAIQEEKSQLEEWRQRMRRKKSVNSACTIS